MSSEPDSLRREIRELYDQKARGDLPDRRFQPRLAEKSVALARMVASAKAETDEKLVAEHHVLYSHFKVTESLLREPEQITASFFAFDRRLVRVRSVLSSTRPVSCDVADETEVDDVPYQGIERIVRRTQLRLGEATAGASIAVLAFLFRQTLAVTGPALLVVGIAGVVHGLLFPTRWVEIVAKGAVFRSPLEIHAVHKRSARALLSAVRERMRNQPLALPGGTDVDS